MRSDQATRGGYGRTETALLVRGLMHRRTSAQAGLKAVCLAGPGPPRSAMRARCTRMGNEMSKLGAVPNSGLFIQENERLTRLHGESQAIECRFNFGTGHKNIPD